MPELVGRTLSHYQVLEEISRGGMGVVYRALDTKLQREIALKVLPADLVSDPARRDRFVTEARAASAIEHPHIAVIHGIDEVDGISFIAMELVRGEKLSDVLARGPLTPTRALELATEVAEGLARAHDKGVIHRDLKPANVMLTEDGHAKIIDFGLAKLVDALSGDSGGQTILKNETDPGMVLGTVSYMSPEQARGGKVDHRSDVFSFGILLHEMLTGRPPFRGNTGIDTMHAILHDPVPALPPLGGTVTADVQRVLEKSLAKDPSERYQGMRDIVVDLRAARRRLDSAAHASAASVAAAVTTRKGFMRAQPWAYVGVGVMVLALVGVGALRSRWFGAAAGSTPGAATDKPSVAVLYFENNTGNPQLDWLRTGLTDMLVTDLSQSPDVEVLPTDRLVQILGDMKRQDDRTISFDTVQEIARRAGVKTVVLGSYVKAGETFRINLKLQDASTGKLVTAERIDAAGESNLLPTVDDLTKRIRAKFVPASADPTRPLLTSPIVVSTSIGNAVDRDLKDVTTSSIEAYRYYAEGINLHEREKERDAIPLLEKAVAIDPGFAMALTKLAVMHGNLGHAALQRDYAKRAFDNLPRLTTRERYYVEGYYYSLNSGTFAKSIDAYNKALELYPDHASARHNLAVMYGLLERYAEAARHYEELRRRGMTFPASYGELAAAYSALGQFDNALKIDREFVEKNPDNVQGYLQLGALLTRWGRYDEGLAAYDKAQALDPGEPRVIAARRLLYVVREQWAEADALEPTLMASPDPTVRAGVMGVRGAILLLHGRSGDALKEFEKVASMTGPRGGNAAAAAYSNLAAILLERGDTAAALADAERAYERVGDTGPQQGLSQMLVAVAQVRLGRQADADATAARLESQMAAVPSPMFQRMVHEMRGRIALERHDTARAIAELRQAESLLPPEPSPAPALGAVNIWFALGKAYLAAGNDAEAAARFQRIVDGGVLRAQRPIETVESLYYLGAISMRTGNRARGGEYFRTFLQYWGDGDIDRDRVADARSKLAGS